MDVFHIVCLLTFCVQLFLKDCFISVYIFDVYKFEKRQTIKLLKINIAEFLLLF